MTKCQVSFAIPFPTPFLQPINQALRSRLLYQSLNPSERPVRFGINATHLIASIPGYLLQTDCAPAQLHDYPVLPLADNFSLILVLIISAAPMGNAFSLYSDSDSSSKLSFVISCLFRIRLPIPPIPTNQARRK